MPLHFTRYVSLEEIALEVENEKNSLTGLQAEPKKIYRHFCKVLSSQKNIQWRYIILRTW